MRLQSTVFAATGFIISFLLCPFLVQKLFSIASCLCFWCLVTSNFELILYPKFSALNSLQVIKKQWRMYNATVVNNSSPLLYWAAIIASNHDCMSVVGGLCCVEDLVLRSKTGIANFHLSALCPMHGIAS